MCWLHVREILTLQELKRPNRVAVYEQIIHPKTCPWGIPLPSTKLLPDILTSMECAVKEPGLRYDLADGCERSLVLVGDDCLGLLIDDGVDGQNEFPETDPIRHVLVTKNHSKS